MAEKCISWIGQQRAAAPDKSLFIFGSRGAAHAPQHVPKEWSDKYTDKFNHGWDRQREITFENRKRLGVVPTDIELTPRPNPIPAWENCSDDEKRL